MSAIMLQDWPTPGNLFEQEKVSSVKEAYKEAIDYGSVRDPDTGLNIPLQTSDGNVETTCSPNDSAYSLKASAESNSEDVVRPLFDQPVYSRPQA